MNQEMSAELGARAASMHRSVAKYGKIILSQWLDSGQKHKLQER